jgi:16S rRNA (guanine966-N2)-methyltransferase
VKRKPRPKAAEPESRRSPRASNDRAAEADVAGVRVIGGSLRGRKLAYSGDVRTRPMKDRTREAIFNLLGEVKGLYVVDLFAGTGALGIEALSRGGAGGVFLEKHFPTADLIRRNLSELALDGRATVAAGDTFLQVRRMQMEGKTFDATRPWLVFCSPPYAFYVERQAEMQTLIDDVFAASPMGSVFVVEADGQFDFATLPDAEAWRIREYPPAVVGIHRKSVGPVPPAEFDDAT